MPGVCCTVQAAAKEQAEAYRSLASLTSDEDLMDALVAIARHLDDVVVPKAALAASAGDFASYRSGVETMGWADRAAYLDPDYSAAFGTVFIGAYVPCGLTVE